MNSTEIKRVTFKDLLNAKSEESNEPLVNVDLYNTDILKAPEKHSEMDANIKAQIFTVRDSVAKKLGNINQKLKDINPNWTLKVFFAYRPAFIQEQWFRERSEFIKQSGQVFANEDDFLEKVHQGVAIPDLAGHPTGGAVDLTIFDNARQVCLDMLSEIGDYNDDEKMSWLAQGTPKQMENRILLLNLMVAEGFAPYWGEWWHYSYGDKEWAVYYNQPNAIYEKI
jgi:D-alanyl-D-alanine dipeptidase